MTDERNELDLDTWVGEGVSDLSDADVVSPYPAAAETLGPAEEAEPEASVTVLDAPPAMEQMGMDGTAVPIVDGPDPDLAEHLLGLILSSRSKGDGHIVTIIEIPAGDGGLTKVASCTCPAIRNLHRRPLGCWGMQIARKLAGIPDPT